MLLAAMMMMALMVAAPAIAQDLPPEAKVTEDVNAKGGPMPEAQAGGAMAKGGPCPDAKAGDVEAKGSCKPPPPPPPPPKMEAAPAPPAPPKALPPTGGAGVASLLGLGAGALLVGGGLLVRKFIR
jgi:hypothetical protein